MGTQQNQSSDVRKGIWRLLDGVSADRLTIVLGVVTLAIQQLLHGQDSGLVTVTTTVVWCVGWALFNTVRLEHAYEQGTPNDLWTLMFRSKAFPVGVGVIVLVVWGILWSLNRMDWITKTVAILPIMLLLITQHLAANAAVKEARARLTPGREEAKPT